ncbi:MAG: NAD(P)-dependent alcohol dehydrogenase [Nocardioidaceae bacterium]
MQREAGGIVKAFVQDRYGGPDTLELREVPAPAPGRGEVLVRVRAVGIDRGTWHLMHGLPLLVRLGLGFRGPRQPTPGRALAGVVEAVGEGVTRFAVGDEVFGTASGSLAELVVASEGRLARKPGSLTFAEAAAVPISAQTALQGLRNIGRVEAGQAVLVIGASGGVGSYAVQLAKAFGAEVTAVCSTGKADLVRSLGADHVIDYTRSDIAEGGRRYDLVLDIAGSRHVAELRRVLTDRGTLVIVGGEGGGRVFGGLERQLGAAVLSPFVRHRLTMFVASENGADLETLTALVDRGAVRPAVDQVFSFESAADAIRRFESGQARGKVVVTV